MKISRIEEAMRLRSDFRDLRKMQAATTGYPRFDGYLCINDEQVPLPHTEVDQLLTSLEARLSDRAAELDVDVDE